MPATAAQIIANQENATHSTGPRTPEGKAASARNSTKFGLFTAHAFVLPEERETYYSLCHAFWQDLQPEGALEETHALEIIRASWRLQRCAKIEATLADAAFENAVNGAPLDPMQFASENEAALRTQNAVDRARTQANTTLRRATAELRRIQTNREIVRETCGDPEGVAILPDCKEIRAAILTGEKAKLTLRKLNGLDSLVGLLENSDRQMEERSRAVHAAASQALKSAA